MQIFKTVNVASEIKQTHKELEQKDVLKNKFHKPLKPKQIIVSETKNKGNIPEDKDVISLPLLKNNDNNAYSLDAEVDALLAAAMQELPKDTLEISKGKTLKSISAEALLADVENEIQVFSTAEALANEQDEDVDVDESFRIKVFKKIKKGLKSTKKTISTRND